MHILMQVEKNLDELINRFVYISERLEDLLPHGSVIILREMIKNITSLMMEARQLLDHIDSFGKVADNEGDKLQRSFSTTHTINLALHIQLNHTERRILSPERKQETERKKNQPLAPIISTSEENFTVPPQSLNLKFR